MNNNNKKYCAVALSINPKILKDKLLDSLYNLYSKDKIRNFNIIVGCQGFSQDDQDFFFNAYPEITFYFSDRIEGKTISYIRRSLYDRYNVFEDYKYVILLDDDFVFKNNAIEQYEHYIEYMDQNPTVGLIACHHRIKKIYKEAITDPDWDYYSGDNLYIISMRTGLICRSDYGKILPNMIFDDSVIYHEELYLAVMYFVKGYDIGKGWVNVYHKQGNLGKSLEKEYSILSDNSAFTSKKVLVDKGLYEVIDNHNYYEPDVEQNLSNLAHELHDKFKEELNK